MHLAQELVDYAIDLLHNDPVTLIQVSLVSRAWVCRTLTQDHTPQSQPLVPLSPSYLIPLCEKVRAPHFTWKGHDNPSSVLNCFELSEPHTLAIPSWKIHDNLDEEAIQRCFAKFHCASITTLELHSVSLTHRTLLTFLSMFPNVENLTVMVDRWCTDLSACGPSGDSVDETFQRVSLPRP